MDPFEGIQVDVISGGNTLALYNDPDEEPSHNLRVRQQYVEAVTGATFQVKVSINPAFILSSLGPHDAVRVKICYDNEAHGWYSDIAAWDITASRLRQESAAIMFSRISHWCNETRQWKSGETTFGALVIADTSDGPTSMNEVQDLGRIQLHIRRVHRIKYDIPRPPVKRSMDVVTQVSEKVLKGKAIANTVCTSEEKSSTGPPPHEYDVRPMEGEHGQPLIYNIFYRSRREIRPISLHAFELTIVLDTLQMLGCIPRTPSPEPEIISATINNTSHEQELQELRARLAYLEHADNKKIEGSNPNIRIKREREEAENAASRKRSRTSEPATIDLTSDD